MSMHTSVCTCVPRSIHMLMRAWLLEAGPRGALSVLNADVGIDGAAWTWADLVPLGTKVFKGKGKAAYTSFCANSALESRATIGAGWPVWLLPLIFCEPNSRDLISRVAWSCAHSEPQGCWLARDPAVPRFAGHGPVLASWLDLAHVNPLAICFCAAAAAAAHGLESSLLLSSRADVPPAFWDVFLVLPQLCSVSRSRCAVLLTAHRAEQPTRSLTGHLGPM